MTTRSSSWHGPALLAALVLLAFADVLGSGGRTIPLAGDVDIHGRLLEFAAGHLRHGHVPLWNPHVFSGMPALGNPNAMMLYPPSLSTVVLPLPIALTAWTVLHTLLLAAFTYVWITRRGLHALGGVLGAVMVAFGAPFFARIHAGHMSALAAMTWAPLVLIAVDVLGRRPSAGWTAVGGVALAMQVLGGHPQYVFYSVLAAAVWGLLGAATARRARVLAGIAVMAVGGACLAAAQLVAVAEAVREASRGGALPYAEAAEFSMPWSGLLTSLVPGFFGHLAGARYWGDWSFAEVTPFVGVVGLTAAAYGLVHGPTDTRRAAGILAGLFLLLALGASTPLFGVLYAYVPPFNRFRASGRALFYFSLFTALLAATGIDALLRAARPRAWLAAVSLAVAVALGMLAGATWWSVSCNEVASWRGDVEAMLRLPSLAREQRIAELAAGDAMRVARLARMAAAHDAFAAARTPAARAEATPPYFTAYVEAMYVNRWQELRGHLVGRRRFVYALQDWADPAAGREDARAVVRGLLIAAATSAAVGLGVVAASNAGAVVVALGVVEMLLFAWAARGTSEPSTRRDDALAAFYRDRPGDYRVHDTTSPNSAMTLGAHDIWGYDPLVPRRYGSYAARTQGVADVGTAGGSFPLSRPHHSFPMLRLAWVLGEQDGGVHILVGPDRLAPPLPRLALRRDYTVLSDGQSVLAALDSPSWDPTRTVILESAPHPVPGIGRDGTVTLRDESTDHVTVEVDLVTPALLLMTDAYGRGWRVRPLEGTSQQHYDLLPANYVLRAVPLDAGHHVLRFEYAPPYFRLGVVVSLASLALVGLVAGRALGTRP